MPGLGKMWIYGLAAAALLLALLGGVKAVYDRGYSARDTKAALEAAIAQAAAKDATDALKSDLAAIKGAQEKERANAKMEIDILRVQLASGAVRLRGPAAAGGVGRSAPARATETRTQPGEAAPVSPAPEPSGVLAAVVELDPATSIELLSIAADGDAAIRDLNECLDSYDALRKRLHGLQRTD